MCGMCLRTTRTSDVCSLWPAGRYGSTLITIGHNCTCIHTSMLVWPAAGWCAHIRVTRVRPSPPVQPDRIVSLYPCDGRWPAFPRASRCCRSLGGARAKFNIRSKLAAVGPGGQGRTVGTGGPRGGGGLSGRQPVVGATGATEHGRSTAVARREHGRSTAGYGCWDGGKHHAGTEPGYSSW